MYIKTAGKNTGSDKCEKSYTLIHVATLMRFQFAIAAFAAFAAHLCERERMSLATTCCMYWKVTIIHSHCILRRIYIVRPSLSPLPSARVCIPNLIHSLTHSFRKLINPLNSKRGFVRLNPTYRD